jgi:hypothetical protein
VVLPTKAHPPLATVPAEWLTTPTEPALMPTLKSLELSSVPPVMS